MLDVKVNAASIILQCCIHDPTAYPCPCCMFVSILRVHFILHAYVYAACSCLHAACPFTCCISMSVLYDHALLHDHVLLHVHVHAEFQCQCSKFIPCCMPMFMQHVHVHMRCMSVLLLHVHVFMLNFNVPCLYCFSMLLVRAASACPCCMFMLVSMPHVQYMLHVHAACPYCMSTRHVYSACS
jgi:hypothetical protein